MKERLEKFAEAFDSYVWKDEFNIVLQTKELKVRLEIINEQTVRMISSNQNEAISIAHSFLAKQKTPMVIYSLDFPSGEKKWITNEKKWDQMLKLMTEDAELTYNFMQGTFTWFIDHDGLKEKYINFKMEVQKQPTIKLIDPYTREAVNVIQHKKDIKKVKQQLYQISLHQRRFLSEVKKHLLLYDEGAVIEESKEGVFCHFLGKFYRFSVKKSPFQHQPLWHVNIMGYAYVCEKEEEVEILIEQSIREVYEKEKIRGLFA